MAVYVLESVLRIVTYINSVNPYYLLLITEDYYYTHCMDEKIERTHIQDHVWLSQGINPEKSRSHVFNDYTILPFTICWVK